MKKFILMALIAIATTFTSCRKDETIPLKPIGVTASVTKTSSNKWKTIIQISPEIGATATVTIQFDEYDNGVFTKTITHVQSVNEWFTLTEQTKFDAPANGSFKNLRILAAEADKPGYSFKF